MPIDRLVSSAPARPVNPRRRWRSLAATLLATLLLPAGAIADPPPGPVSVAQATGTPTERPITIRGTVAGLGGSELRIDSAAGPAVVRLVPPLVVTGATRASLADIRPGTFLGTAARAEGTGTSRALEVHIFAETMRGTGEGHRPMDVPGTTMTNATVDAIVEQTDGPVLTLRHKDGVTRVLVPPDTPIVQLAPGDASLLVPGASIAVRAQRAADGTLSASRLTVGVNGARLPM